MIHSTRGSRSESVTSAASEGSGSGLQGDTLLLRWRLTGSGPGQGKASLGGALSKSCRGGKRGFQQLV